MQDVKVFHAGTRFDNGRVVTDGGRVLAVTALGETLALAKKRAYEAVAKIGFKAAHYRTDIADKALKPSRRTDPPSSVTRPSAIARITSGYNSHSTRKTRFANVSAVSPA